MHLRIRLLVIFLVAGLSVEASDGTELAITLADITVDKTQARETLVTSLLKACPGMFVESEIKDLVFQSLAYKTGPVVPFPGNIKQTKLPVSPKLKVIISGSNQAFTAFPELYKLTCLNHLAFVFSRQISGYRFLNPALWRHQLSNLSPHWMKVVALKEVLPQLPDNQWIMWIDDDVLTSDFSTVQLSLPDRLIEEYADSIDESVRPSVLVSSDPYTKVNTGVVLVRNSPEGNLFLQHWWETRVDDLHPLVKNSKGAFYCGLTGKTYNSMLACMNACGVDVAADKQSCLPKQEVLWEGLPHHDQTAFYRMLFSPQEFIDVREEATNDRLYLGSHVVKIIPQKRRYRRSGYEGFNTFYGDRELGEEARAFDPSNDKWVHVSGLGSDPIKRTFYLLRWLNKVSDMYPYVDERSNQPLWDFQYHETPNDHKIFSSDQSSPSNCLTPDTVVKGGLLIIGTVIVYELIRPLICKRKYRNWP